MSKNWQKEHPEYKKEYNFNHHEYRNEYMRQYREDNPEVEKQWARDHREQKNKNNSKYYKTEKGKIDKQRSKAKRRELGFNPLNKSFEGSTPHHINLNDVIYIPKKIHQSISHCLETGKNMKEINKLAISYMEGVV